MKTLESTSNTASIEARLNKYPYLSKNTLPGYPDAKVFSILESNKSTLISRQNFLIDRATLTSTTGSLS